MAKENNKPTLEQAAQAFNQLATTGNAPVTYDQAFEILEKADDKELQEISSEYWTPEEMNKSYSFLAVGIETTDIKQSKNVKVVKMQGKDGSNVICGDKVLVSAVEKLTVLPAYIRVKWVSNADGANGQYKVIQVRTFAF